MYYTLTLIEDRCECAPAIVSRIADARARRMVHKTTQHARTHTSES
jgi:hypothetical protein